MIADDNERASHSPFRSLHGADHHLVCDQTQVEGFQVSLTHLECGVEHSDGSVGGGGAADGLSN